MSVPVSKAPPGQKLAPHLPLEGIAHEAWVTMIPGGASRFGSCEPELPTWASTVSLSESSLHDLLPLNRIDD